tara:strand:- start:445 stop:666 length:222 start_codon:yes stop_codon:yes gene_type:complete
MTIKKQIEELTKQVVQAAKDNNDYLVTKIGNKINDLREIEELTNELIQSAKDDDTVSCVSIIKKIQTLKKSIK